MPNPFQPDYMACPNCGNRPSDSANAMRCKSCNLISCERCSPVPSGKRFNYCCNCGERNFDVAGVIAYRGWEN